MRYVSEWERLSDALARVKAATGLSSDEARIDICRAIAGGAVKIRGKLKEHLTRHMKSDTVLEGINFDIKAEIKSQDLDWEASRPMKPWIVRRGAFEPSGFWHLEWIELLRTDVERVLHPLGPRGEATQHASASEAVDKNRSRPAFERARSAVEELYPEGVPKPAAEPNAILCRRVGEKLKEQSLPDVSDDTILRAAGRRRK
jgi:hypothetical protein